MLLRDSPSGSQSRNKRKLIGNHTQSSVDKIDITEPLNEDGAMMEHCILNIFDPRYWDNLDDRTRDILIEKGPLRDNDLKFPLDELSGHFSYSYYTRTLPNGETQDRNWLVYSKDANKVYCFCCKLFKSVQNDNLLANEGLNDWKNLSGSLKKHETTVEHMSNMMTWYDLRTRLKHNQPIDEELQVQIKKGKDHWKRVLVRLISVVKCFASGKLVFHGENEIINQNDSDIFIGLLELIAEFDLVMQEHFRLIQNKEIHYHYLSHGIQYELISAMASEVKSAIIKKIKEAKYYSLIVDCNPGASHNEQMAVIIRCVDMLGGQVKVEEYFIELLKVNDTLGFALFDEIKLILESLELDIDNLRGQCYVNGSDKKGRYQGVHKRLLEINPRAFYMPYACHSLTLTTCDMLNSCDEAALFFGVVQCLYTLFASSTKTWKILQDHVHKLTLKSLSITRWESHVDCIAAIITQPDEIREALFELSSVSKDARISSEAKSLATYGLESFDFLLGMIIWHNILNRINLSSEKLQFENMQIDVAIVALKDLIAYFEKYREDGFQLAMVLGKELASRMEIDPIFPPKRKIRRKNQFDETCDEDISLSAEESFRINYFLVVVDIVILSLKRRLEQLEVFEGIFGFLFNHKLLSSLDENTLHECCVKLQDALKYNDKYDIVARELFPELQVLQMCLPRDLKSVIEVLEFVEKLGCFPYVSIAYKILLTLPVTVASTERKFSKLEMLKSDLHSPMSEETLGDLAILCVESETLEKLDFKDLINDFASQNASRFKLFQ